MDLTNKRSDESNFHYLYAVDFCGKRIILPNTMKFVVGRSNCSDLIISSPRVSRKHCEIICSKYGWQLHNLSPVGTSLVGKVIARHDTVQLQNDDILKLGNTVFIQCKMDIEPAQSQPAMRVLRIVVLIGEDVCSLASEPGTPANDLCNRRIQEVKDDSVVEIPCTNSLNERGTENKDNLMDNLNAEKQHIMQELEETKAALKTALVATGEAELKMTQMKGEYAAIQQNSNKTDIIEEVIESELQCSICNELLVDAVTLNCSHTFCEYCLREWKKKNKICPLCRARILHECKTRTIDSVIDRVVGNLSEAIKNRRVEVVDSRKALKRHKRQSRKHTAPKRRRTLREVHERVVRISVNYADVLEETIDLSVDDSD